jgi:hypothetical protein
VDDYVPGNSYVVSPTNAYADYGRAETHLLGSASVRLAANALLAPLGTMLRAARLDRVVHVNNWMLSTNLYPHWDGSGLEAATQGLSREFGERAIVFRSLNEFSNAALLDAFRRAGYLLVPSRRVYIHDARDGMRSPSARRKNFVADSRLFAKSGYQPVRLEVGADAAIFARIERLYAQLYLEKYPDYNPRFLRTWLEEGHRAGWLRLVALRSREGRIDGVVGFFGAGETLTVPVVGYDTELPQQLGLYRMLTWMCLNEAIEARSVLNFSAGAGEFKRLRGGVPYVEYSAVDCRHLPLQRRLAWKSLREALERVVVPLMIRYGL